MAIFDPLTIFVSILVGLISLLTYHVFKFYSKVKKFPPGPTPLPFIGNIFHFKEMKHNHDIIEEMAKKYGKVMTLWLGEFPHIIVTDTELALHVFRTKTFSGRTQLAFTDQFKSSPGSEYVSFGDFNTGWEVLRRMMFAALRKYTASESLPQQTKQMVDQVMDRVLVKKAGVDMKDTIRLITTPLLAKSLFGLDVSLNEPLLQDLKELVSIFERFGTAILLLDYSLIFRFWYRKTWQKVVDLSVIYKKMLYKQIEDHESTYQPDITRDIVDAFIWTRETAEKEEDADIYSHLTRDNIMNAITDLFQAGSETTKTTLHWFFLMLCLRPDWQSKIHREIKDNLSDEERYPDLDMRDQFPLLRAFILEVFILFYISFFILLLFNVISL